MKETWDLIRGPLLMLAILFVIAVVLSLAFEWGPSLPNPFYD